MADFLGGFPDEGPGDIAFRNQIAVNENLGTALKDLSSAVRRQGTLWAALSLTFLVAAILCVVLIYRPSSPPSGRSDWELILLGEGTACFATLAVAAFSRFLLLLRGSIELWELKVANQNAVIEAVIYEKLD